MACRITELVLDARDPELLARFWCEVLGYIELERDEASIEIGPPDVGFGGPQPTIFLSQTDEPKAGARPAPDESILGRPAPSHGMCSVTLKVTSSAY